MRSSFNGQSNVSTPFAAETDTIFPARNSTHPDRQVPSTTITGKTSTSSASSSFEARVEFLVLNLAQILEPVKTSCCYGQTDAVASARPAQIRTTDVTDQNGGASLNRLPDESNAASKLIKYEFINYDSLAQSRCRLSLSLSHTHTHTHTHTHSKTFTLTHSFTHFFTDVFS